jgi:hypothetical protein
MGREEMALLGRHARAFAVAHACGLEGGLFAAQRHLAASLVISQGWNIQIAVRAGQRDVALSGRRANGSSAVKRAMS